MKPNDKPVGYLGKRTRKGSSFDPLSEDSLRLLVETIETAHSMGYSTSDFPAEILLDLMIDASLRLSEAFRGSGIWKARSNPELKFLERPIEFRKGRYGSGPTGYDGPQSGATFGTGSGQRNVRSHGVWEAVSDELGNVAQQRIQRSPENSFNPELVKFFTDLAKKLVKVKQTHDLPKDLYSKEESVRQRPANKISNQTYWYWKRREHRLREQRTHPKK